MNTKQIYKLIFVVLLLSFAFMLESCSKDTNPTVNVSHPEGWSSSSSTDFHGSKAIAIDRGFCMDCHGTDLKGGESKVSCYSCHSIYPHSAVWSEINSLYSHGKLYKDSTETCMPCHGTDLKGGESKSSCFNCHPVGSF